VGLLAEPSRPGARRGGNSRAKRCCDMASASTGRGCGAEMSAACRGYKPVRMAGRQSGTSANFRIKQVGP
jgi:hypothetical protein